MSTKQTRTRGEDYQAPVPVPREQRRRGRPSEFDEAIMPEVLELVGQGATTKELADHLGVHPAQFWRWCQAYPHLRSAVKAAREAQDDRVEEALRINAVLEGNVTAQIFWLKNRRPNEWRDRKETEIIVPVADDVGEVRDARGAALAALALFNEAQYDPGATGMLLEATANAEETDDGAEDTGRAQGAEAPRGSQEPGDDDWGDEPAGYDIDPGEL
jgi:hypothetical protein